MDIWQRTDAEPVLPAVRDEILGPFIAAVGVTLTELAGLEPAVRSVYRVASPRTFGDLSATLSLGTSEVWELVLSFPRATASALAGRVLAGAEGAPDDDLIGDCMGELANVIAGQAKTMLAESPYQLELATPEVLAGERVDVGPSPEAESFVIVFGSELGAFALQLCRRRSGSQR